MEKKKEYSLLNNYVYALKMAKKSSNILFWVILGTGIIGVVLTLIQIYLPKIVLSLVEHNATTKIFLIYIVVVGILIIFLYIVRNVSWQCFDTLYKKTNGYLNKKRMNKIYETDFKNMESPDFLDCVQKAKNALNYGFGFHGILYESRNLISQGMVVIISAVILGTKNIIVMLSICFLSVGTSSGISERENFHRFREENSFWLRDYAIFMAVKTRFGGKSIEHWAEDIRFRWGYSMEYYQRELYYEIEFYEFIQYEFYRQWFRLKQYANENGIQIIGDIPIYVAYDSADVWAHPELFQMDEEGKPVAVAGCPPDGFSATGQLWGNPLYKWDYHKATGYDWWIRRIEKCCQLYDVIRIDHFRGFDQYFSIPANAKDAREGRWENGPGIELFHVIKERLGDIHIIAEDLGYITDTVRALVRDSGFPNMKVLEFAFDSRDSSGPAEYLPYNYEKNCVVYTGTHDNETLLGWLNSILQEEVDMIGKYIGKDVKKKTDLVYELIRLAQASTANTCIIPIQDYLCLGNEARMNTPSTLGNNWKWRVLSEQLSDKLAERIKEYTVLYGRAG